MRMRLHIEGGLEETSPERFTIHGLPDREILAVEAAKAMADAR